MAVDDVVEGEEGGGGADNKQILYGKEANTVGTEFCDVFEKETQGFDWMAECSVCVRK